MTPPAEVARLVERFHEQRDDYRSGRYNEAQLRQDFFNPFFKALGWDVHNERGWSEAHREVTVIQTQIDATDHQIDRLLYELYGLTDQEILIVEQATGQRSWRDTKTRPNTAQGIA